MDEREQSQLQKMSKATGKLLQLRMSFTPRNCLRVVEKGGRVVEKGGRVVEKGGRVVERAEGCLKGAERSPKVRGWCQTMKVNKEIVEKVFRFVEKDPLISLAEMSKELLVDERLQISTTNVHKHLETRFYTTKKSMEPENIRKNRNKRATLVSQLMDSIGAGNK